MADLPAIDLPRPHPAAPATPGAGATLTRRPPDSLVDTARGYADVHGVPLPAVWRAALLTVLHRYTGQTDLADATFTDVVARCATAAGPEAPFRVRLARTTAELTVVVGPADLRVEYPAVGLDADTVNRLLDHVIAALAGGLAAPDAAIADLDILPPAEREQVLRTWHPPPAPRAPGLLHQVAAGHDPDRVAIRLHHTGPDGAGPNGAGPDGAELTYGDLDRRANRLAHALHEHGIGPGHIVGLLLDRGPHLPIAQLAVMKAGAAWLPLDPQHPPARLAFLVHDAATALVLTTTDLTALAPVDTPLWNLDGLTCPGPDTPPAVDVRPDDPAYLLYTSGSTGIPKGVLVPHYSAHAYCHTAVELFRTTPADRVAQASNPAFDASIFDCYATLLAGATLISAPRETIVDTAAFTDYIRAERVTLSYIPPAVLALLDPDDFAGSALRGIFSAGEALPPEQASRWSRPGLELHNSYGPTETTVVVTDYLCTAAPLSGPTPIGAALPNHRAYALDERLRPVPVGVFGMLLIAGTGVTYGYHHRPGLTAERFLPDPYARRPGERMYATGDLVRWRADGILEFHGRRDRQVQLRGQRVELGEIEHTLTQHPDVRQCAVLLHDSANLVAYLAGEPDLDELRAYLAERLPTFMIPTRLVTLPALPLTPNGKLDTDRLPDPSPAPATEHVEPRTEAERWLAANWRELIGVDQVGATDNFFDLGGNSLHVTRLTARVRDHLDIDLHPQHLFTHPTLEHLAARLDQIRDDGAAPADTGVVTLQAGGPRPPLFLVHPVGGSVTPYAQLATMLGGDRPVHAIEDPGLRGAVSADGLAERARRYVELVRRVQPDGPYHLGGWSIGAVIGLEMARQLTDAGASVAVVLALDSGLPPPQVADDDLGVLVGFVRDLAGRAGVAPPPLDADAYRDLDRDTLEERVLDVLDKAGLAPSDLREEMHLRMRVSVANIRALLAYEPRPYGGRFVLVRAAETDAEAEFDRWPAMLPHLEQRTVPGNHHTMLEPPHLSTLAVVLRDVLRTAPSSGDTTPPRPGRLEEPSRH